MADNEENGVSTTEPDERHEEVEHAPPADARQGDLLPQPLIPFLLDVENGKGRIFYVPKGRCSIVFQLCWQVVRCPRVIVQIVAPL